jgi:Fe2+ or Zn2+ uptake regulation protein
MNQLSLERLHQYLAEIHHSRTAARDAVWLALHRLGRCRPAAVRTALAESNLDRVTIYRTLRFFRESGILHELPNGMIELTDRFKQHHHHFVCRRCGREISFNDQPLERALARIASAQRIKLEAHQVELTGLCPECTRLN